MKIYGECFSKKAHGLKVQTFRKNQVIKSKEILLSEILMLSKLLKNK
jgi:hypothetical protein